MAGERHTVIGWVRGLVGVSVVLLAAACGTAPSFSHGQTSAMASTPAPSPSAPTIRASGRQGFEPMGASFISVRRGWVLGRNGCRNCAGLKVTHDGGEHWTRLPSPPTRLGPGTEKAAVTGVAFATSSDGFLFGPGLLATYDGGRSWSRQSLPPVETVQASPRYAYALTQSRQSGPVRLWRSAVGSGRWHELRLPAGSAPLPAAQFPVMRLSVEGGTVILLQVGVTGVGVTPGTVGRLWVSGDNGEHWRAQSVPCTSADGGAALVSIATGHPGAWLVDCFNNEQSSQEQNTQNHLYGTADAGRSLVRLPDPTRHNMPGLLADNGSGHAFLATDGDADTLVGTTDGGRHWHFVLQSGGSFSGWADLRFLNATTGYLVGPVLGSRGRLYWTRDGGRTWQIVHA